MVRMTVTFDLKLPYNVSFSFLYNREAGFSDLKRYKQVVNKLSTLNITAQIALNGAVIKRLFTGHSGSFNLI